MLFCDSAWLWLSLGGACSVLAQQVVDRIAARVEEEIILQSDVEQLARYQLLVDGRPKAKCRFWTD